MYPRPRTSLINPGIPVLETAKVFSQVFAVLGDAAQDPAAVFSQYLQRGNPDPTGERVAGEGGCVPEGEVVGDVFLAGEDRSNRRHAAAQRLRESHHIGDDVSDWQANIAPVRPRPV